MSELGKLADSGAPEVLRGAVRVLRDRGWTKGATRDLETGEVDVLGAIAIAAGAKIGEVDDRPDLLTTSVPVARRAAALAAWEALEWACDAEPVEWQDNGSRRIHDVVGALTKAADRLTIAIR
jgi:hypothetical protein